MTTLTLSGEINRDVGAIFIEQLAALGRADAPVILDMRNADLEDAVVTAALLEHIRAAAAHTGQVQIISAPQVLAHGLYRLGELGHDAHIQLIDPRQEIDLSS